MVGLTGPRIKEKSKQALVKNIEKWLNKKSYGGVV